VPQYDKHGDDDGDAFHLAHLLRIGILPEGYIYPRAERPLRDLLRRRPYGAPGRAADAVDPIDVLAPYRTRLVVNRLSRADGRTVGADPSRFDSAIRRRHPADRETLQVQIERFERWISDSVKSRAQFAGLRSVPGIGLILGLTILLETGAISRFARRRAKADAAIGTWPGPTSRRRISPCASARRSAPGTTASAPSVIIALKAVAHKIARACYFILRDEQRFDLKRAFD
jgi:hypothetical protein